ncbi:hypothetical protein J2Z18_003051 [Paenibacillus lactis]|uniref:Uncharacterized protein n=2 Tax=Paenibacillus lactis TaxID=228574 RepID=G4HL38_9BACL|nr:hypothetical protein PaelaDRAFT_4699 [Paenibacillus lactis 154]MBP1893948.1 hypothetical protein [Paenibacillus lactis]
MADAILIGMFHCYNEQQNRRVRIVLQNILLTILNR